MHINRKQQLTYYGKLLFLSRYFSEFKLAIRASSCSIRDSRLLIVFSCASNFSFNSCTDLAVNPIYEYKQIAILFFVKLGTAYFDYRKHGQFEFTAPAILFLGLLTFPTNMLLGLGIMLAANEVPRIAQQFGLDSSVKVNMMSVVHATTTAVNLSRSVARAAK